MSAIRERPAQGYSLKLTFSSLLSSLLLRWKTTDIAHMIDKDEKPHSIGQALIKPCMLKAASFVLGETNCKKIANIYLPDSNVN